MKYKIKKITAKVTKKGELVEFSSLYDFGIFCEKDESLLVLYKKRTSKLKRFWLTLWERFNYRIGKYRARPENPLLMPALLGALSATLLVMALTFSVIGYRLVLKNYFGSYTTVAVPNFVGENYPSSDIFASSDFCNITVTYEYSNDIPSGVVISQSPAGGALRRVYRKKSNCNAELVVSLGKRVCTMPDFCGSSLRDTLLELKNSGVKFSVERDYSSDVPKGSVISTHPAKGSTFFADDTVTLTVSLGKRVIYNTVPNLFGMTENRARTLIFESGFLLGTINYEASELPMGTVISQSRAAYSAAIQGESISFTISAGQKYNEKRIPDLYGLSIEEARARLADAGLVLGNIYAVANAAKKGTVVWQSIAADTPIRSDIYSVDVYVSS